MIKWAEVYCTQEHWESVAGWPDPIQCCIILPDSVCFDSIKIKLFY